MLINIILVGAGSMFGGIARYLVALLAMRYFPSRTYLGTLAVNIIGSFIIAAVAGVSERADVLSPETRLFLATGICGGFTTFSAFAFEELMLLRGNDIAAFFFYAFVSFTSGVIAAAAGWWIFRGV